jgi:hypothetical protein
LVGLKTRQNDEYIIIQSDIYNMTKIYKLKIKLLDNTRPPIWRKLLILSTSTFWDLHVLIRDSFGWSSDKLHMFRIRLKTEYEKKTYKHIPTIKSWINENDNDDTPNLSWNCKIKKYFESGKHDITYDHDVFHGLEHRIIIEKILPRAGEAKQNSKCIAGQGTITKYLSDESDSLSEPVNTKFYIKNVVLTNPADELLIHKEKLTNH